MNVVVHHEVAIQTLFQGMIKVFHHTGLGIPAGREMMNAFPFHQILECLVVKLFSVIPLKVDGFSIPFLQNLFKRLLHGFPCLVFYGLDSGVFRKDVYHRQQIAIPAIVLGNVDHFDAIRRSLLVDSEHHHAVGNWRCCGLCNVYPKSRSRTSRARLTVILLAFANRVRPPRLPGLCGSRYRFNNVLLVIFLFLFIISKCYTRKTSTNRNVRL